MSDNISIKIRNVSKTFKLPHEKNTSLKSTLINFRKRGYEKQRVLDDISFEIKKGEFFGIVGRNGSGKSTLLKLLAGTYTPSSGDIQINGKLTPFIELGVGFNPELSGRENVFLNGALLGFNRKEMQGMYADIVAFAELERFMDQKLKNYSSGMQVRLAFSIAIRAQSDILLLDEVLAVGDAIFQQKCFNYFGELKKSNKTILLVSHDSNVLRQYCSSGILLEDGELVKAGSIQGVLDEYAKILMTQESNTKTTKSSSRRVGSGKIVVEKTVTLNEKHVATRIFTNEDDKILVKAKYLAKAGVERPMYGITIEDEMGNRIFASNNQWLAIKSDNIKKGSYQEVIWEIPNIFNTGDYSIVPAVADEFGKETFDRVDRMAEFKVRKSYRSSALVNAAHSMKLL